MLKFASHSTKSSIQPRNPDDSAQIFGLSLFSKSPIIPPFSEFILTHSIRLTLIDTTLALNNFDEVTFFTLFFVTAFASWLPYFQTK